MRVSLNWAQHHSNVHLAPNGIDDLITKIGAQLGAVEEVINYGEQYRGSLVARVVSCEKHPNADKLNVCFIDDGGVATDVGRNADGYVQVVCGAPNVQAGLLVVWLPPGATVPSTYHNDPFVLGARELRGVLSNGMLASASELAISDDHAGILVIDTEVQPGTAFASMYGLDDVIIDIENKMFTHRPDCFGVLGVAREIAGIYGQRFVSPTWYADAPSFTSAQGLPLSIQNEIPELVPRFMAVTMKDVVVAPSPIWLQAGLNRVGIKSINNIVDITNYLAYVTGQPLHAYDYDKLAARSSGDATLVVRHPREAESIALLNGKTIVPRTEAIVIATDHELVGVGGVMGGSSTEVDAQTKNIVIECANFDMYSIRRTSMAHGLFTDAVTRNNKGQSPLQNSRIIAKAVELVASQAGGVQASDVLDHVDCDRINVADDGWADGEIAISADFINARTGLALSGQEITNHLLDVEFGCDARDDGNLTVYAPFWRTDIAIKEDIVEEIGRLHGFGTLPLELPQRRTTPSRIDAPLALKQQLRETLASFGANEVLTYSFVHGNLLEKASQNKDLAFKLTNAISPDLQYYRMSLTPSLLAHIHPNIKSGASRFSIFEINKTHIKQHATDDAGLPKEIGMVTLVTADKNRSDAAYFQARAYLDALASSLGVTLEYAAIPELIDYQVVAPFEHTRSALVTVAGTDIMLGIVGEYKKSVAKAFKLPAFCAGFEIDLNGLLAIQSRTQYVPLSRYPSISQDLCLEVAQSTSYKDLTQKLRAALVSDLALSISLLDIYQPNESVKRITYRITATSYDQTLTDATVSRLLDNAVAALPEAARI